MDTPGDSDYFRASVGAMVVDPESRKVLVLRRADVRDADVWQMPQGGIQQGESPRDALMRELREETGLTPNDYEIVGEYEDWLAYELPEEYRSAKTGRGQVQRWFLVELRTPRNAVTPDQLEFDRVRWVTLEQLTDLASPFRRSVYETLTTFAVAKAR